MMIPSTQEPHPHLQGGGVDVGHVQVRPEIFKSYLKPDWFRFELSFFYSSEDSGSADWPWCAVFSSQEMALLEQNEDLHYYYQDGYHYNISRQMTGVLLGDLLGMAVTSKGKKSSVKAFLYRPFKGLDATICSTYDTMTMTG